MPNSNLTDYQEMSDCTVCREITNQSGQVYVQADFRLDKHIFRKRWLQKFRLITHDGKLWIPKWYAGYLLDSIRQAIQQRQPCRRCHCREVYAFEADNRYWLRCARCHRSPAEKYISESKVIEQGIPLRKLEDVLEHLAAKEQYQWRDRMTGPPADLTRFFEQS